MSKLLSGGRVSRSEQVAEQWSRLKAKVKERESQRGAVAIALAGGIYALKVGFKIDDQTTSLMTLIALFFWVIGFSWDRSWSVVGRDLSELSALDAVVEPLRVGGAWTLPPSNVELISRLRIRAAILRKRADGFMLFLFVIIAGGVALYLLAAQVATSSRNWNLERIARNVDSIKTSAETQQDPELSRSVQEVSKQLDAELRSATLEHDKLEFYGIISVRIGAILMLFFLARFTINAYRYTSRLAAAYDARADALELKWEDAQEARRFMSVDDHGFEDVRSPTEDAIEIASKLLDKRSE